MVISIESKAGILRFVSTKLNSDDTFSGMGLSTRREIHHVDFKVHRPTSYEYFFAIEE